LGSDSQQGFRQDQRRVHAQGEVPGGDHQEEARGDRVRLAVIEKQNCFRKIKFRTFLRFNDHSWACIVKLLMV